MDDANGRRAAIAAVCDLLGARRLIWFGIRGEDGEALQALPDLAASFAAIAPLRGNISVERNVTYESLSGRRPDLDDPALDLDSGDAAAEFQRRLAELVTESCVVMTYRPTEFVSALGFSNADTMTVAGMHHERQNAFEHKPWVEQALAKRGIRGLGWRYVADEQRDRVKALLVDGPQILRASRMSGGAGIALVETEAEVDQRWPEQPESFVAVAPYLAEAVPVNFSGCVFSDGSVRWHPPSVQLIGIPSCTDRPFGYCGNDFGRAKSFDSEVMAELEGLGHQVAQWLFEERYRGAFGVDALVHDGHAYFTEINPRFQGSSGVSAEIASALDVSDLFLDHLGAFLGETPLGRGIAISEWARQQPAVSHIVVHNTSSRPVVLGRDAPDRSDHLAPVLSQVAREARVEPRGALGRLKVRRSVTTTGFELDQAGEDAVLAVRRLYVESAG